MGPLPKALSDKINLINEVHINSNDLKATKAIKTIDPLDDYSLALTYQAYGELEKSIEYFEKSELHGLEEVNIYRDLGIAYYTKGDINKSFDYFKQAIINDPNDAIAFIGLGIIYFERNDTQAAKKHFYKAKEACPILKQDINTLFTNY